MFCDYCGRELISAEYTLAWEDGDNEYGFWTCPYCGEITEDLSGDD